MENKRDAMNLQQQFNLLKQHNEKTREYISAIELLMVDNNNCRVKDSKLSKNLQDISNLVSHLNNAIDGITIYSND